MLVYMSYPGLNTSSKTRLYKSICMPSLTYGMDSLNLSSNCMKQLETAQGNIPLPTRNLCIHMLGQYVLHPIVIPGSLRDRVTKLGVSPISLCVTKPKKPVSVIMMVLLTHYAIYCCMKIMSNHGHRNIHLSNY